VGDISGIYNKHIVIINDDINIVNKFEASLSDDTRVVIYDCHMFIVQATEAYPIVEHQKGSSIG
jgi:hypothetical protein